jgi:hypothetical protein
MIGKNFTDRDNDIMEMANSLFQAVGTQSELMKNLKA